MAGSTSKLLLEELMDEGGARFAGRHGWRLPLHFGDPCAEVERARRSCALFDHSFNGRVEVVGADRRRFLNGLATANVKELESHRGLDTFFTNQQGRVLADAHLEALEDRLLMEVVGQPADALRDHLERYIIADDVALRSLEDLLPLTLVGPRAGAAVTSWGGEGLAEGSNQRMRLAGTEVQVARSSRVGLDAYTLWIPAAIAVEVVADLTAATDCGWLGMLAWDQLRVEAGELRWGTDFDAGYLPQETGLLHPRVDFEKGCYLGQEIIARLHYRGTPKRLACRLRLDLADGASCPGPGTELEGADGPVGTLTTVATLGDVPRALAVVAKGAAAEGRTLTTGGGSVRAVVEAVLGAPAGAPSSAAEVGEPGL